MRATKIALLVAGVMTSASAMAATDSERITQLEQQLATSQQQMDPALWQQHKEEVLSQWRRDFFAREQGKP